MKITKPSTLFALLNGEIDNALLSETPGGIEAQEKAGQDSFVNSETLPIKCNSGSWEQLEEMGIVSLEERKLLKPNELFIHVRLPDGWKKKPSDHSMWSYIVDEYGRERLSCFYKAAFYDTDAFINISRRYSCRSETNDRIVTYSVVDADGTVLFNADPYNESQGNVYNTGGKYDKAQSQCKEYLDKNFPDWENPLAYWD